MNFKIINQITGHQAGNIKGANLEEAQDKAREKGFDIYDDYFIILATETIHPASSHIEEITNTL